MDLLFLPASRAQILCFLLCAQLTPSYPARDAQPDMTFVSIFLEAHLSVWVLSTVMRSKAKHGGIPI